MRGKAPDLYAQLIAERITPAYAGKRGYHRCSYKNRWDHPRLCGEKVCGVLLDRGVSGITPAYAGKS